MTIGISGMPITDNINLAITGILREKHSSAHSPQPFNSAIKGL